MFSCFFRICRLNDHNSLIFKEYISPPVQTALVYLLLSLDDKPLGGTMNSSDFQNVPKCTFDQSLEFTPSEIGSLAHEINILLKTAFLIGDSKDIEGTFQSLFDIAEEIAGVECCAYISEAQASSRFETVASRRIPSKMEQDPSLFAPAEIARHLGKVIQLDAGKDPYFRSICETWQAAPLAVFPLRRSRDFIG